MILPFEQLKHRSFSLSDIRVILQRPVYRLLQNKGRLCNGLIYVVEGECQYIFDGGEFSLSPGSVAYLPLGSTHTLTVISSTIRFYRVDFTLHVDGELAFFSDCPMKLTDQAPPSCVEAICALEGDFGVGDNTILKVEKMCAVLASLQSADSNAAQKRLMPAVRFLQEHAAESIDCSALAEMCFLGTSRFYQLFHEEFGMAPLEYRDRLLLNRATALLAAGDLSVREVAFAVGFESASYFSRFFKKQTGLPPSAFLKK